jgi:ATP-binding cassette subfamily B protein
MPPSASSISVPDSLAVQTATLRSKPELHEGETVLATMEPDLDAEMRFVSSRVLLTNLRMISDSAGGGWISWTLQPGMKLEHTDHAGVGTLSLHDAQSCLARWRFTLEQEVGAIRLLRQYERLEASQAGLAMKQKSAQPAIGNCSSRCRRGSCFACGVLPSPTKCSYCWDFS